MTHYRTSLKRLRTWLGYTLDGTPHAFNLPAIMTVAVELATNALVHSRSGLPGGSLGVQLTWNGDTVRIAVQDQGGASTQPRPAVLDVAVENGRGLFLVDALSTRWGWSSNAFGVLVWGEVDLNP